MKLLDLLRKQHDYSWDKETWFLPLKDVLEGLSSADAAWQPPGGGNTIWQIVNHLNYYNNRLIHDIAGRQANDALPSNLETFGAPGNPEDNEAWQDTLEKADQLSTELRKALAKIDDGALKEEYADGLSRNILHTIHHTGQIVLIRKQQGSWMKERE